MVTVCHHSASLVMPICDPQDGFLYPILSLMIDNYILKFFGEIYQFLLRDMRYSSKYYKEYGILGTPFQGLNSIYHNNQLALSETSLVGLDLNCFQRGLSNMAKCFRTMLFNPFKQNVISHSYQLDQSMSVLRVVGWHFSTIFKF